MRHASCSLGCEEDWSPPGCLVSLLTCDVQFLKVSFDSLANSFALMFNVWYITNLIEVKPSFLATRAKSPLCAR
jgi:hypothetical protein